MNRYERKLRRLRYRQYRFIRRWGFINEDIEDRYWTLYEWWYERIPDR